MPGKQTSSNVVRHMGRRHMRRVRLRHSVVPGPSLTGCKGRARRVSAQNVLRSWREVSVCSSPPDHPTYTHPCGVRQSRDDRHRFRAPTTYCRDAAAAASGAAASGSAGTFCFRCRCRNRVLRRRVTCMSRGVRRPHPLLHQCPCCSSLGAAA
eukprot:365445-Chlamydomonas_euryale.AAC.18